MSFSVTVAYKISLPPEKQDKESYEPVQIFPEKKIHNAREAYTKPYLLLCFLPPLLPSLQLEGPGFPHSPSLVLSSTVFEMVVRLVSQAWLLGWKAQREFRENSCSPAFQNVDSMTEISFRA